MRTGEFDVDFDDILRRNLESVDGQQRDKIEQALDRAEPDFQSRFAPVIPIVWLARGLLLAAVINIIKTYLKLPPKVHFSPLSPAPTIMVVKGAGIDGEMTITADQKELPTSSMCTTLEPAPGPACRTDPIPLRICTEKLKFGCIAGPVATPFIFVKPLEKEALAELSSAKSALSYTISSLDALHFDVKVSALTALPTPMVETSSTIDCKLTAEPTKGVCTPLLSQETVAPEKRSCRVEKDDDKHYCKCVGDSVEFSMLTPGQSCGATAAPYNCIEP